jgi:hypothetical protein
MRVVTVLRSGSEYTPEHVQRLAKQVREHLPGEEFFALSDVPVPGVDVLPMQFRWPGWWSKMELMAPHVAGDLLYFDLDTTIVGSLADLASLAATGVWAPCADFYKPYRLQTSMAVFGETGRRLTWCRWMSIGPEQAMAAYRGDGEFVNSVWCDECPAVQDLLPRQVVSYKVDVMKDPLRRKQHKGTGVVPPGARVVCFHGQPRPWNVAELRFA